jgi:hypothetical protein
MKLTLRELIILESELRIVDPTANKELSYASTNKLLDEYEKLTNKLADEISKRKRNNKYDKFNKD